MKQESNLNLLFISASLEMQDTSAAIRNRRLLNELCKHYNITSIEYHPYDATPVSSLSISKKIRIPLKFYAVAYGKQYVSKSKFDFGGKFRTLIRWFVPDKISLYVLLHYFFGFDLGDKFDVIVTSSDPKGIHFLWLSPFFKIKHLKKDGRAFQYWGDPWYGDIYIKSNFITKYFERIFFSTVDFVFFNSLSTARDKKLEHSNLSSRITYLSRGYLRPDITLPNKAMKKLRNAVFLYAGSYDQHARNICPLLDAALALGIDLLVVGDGPCINNTGPRIHFIDRVSAKDLEVIEQTVDCYFIILNKYGTQLPGKIFDAASGNKPILVLYENKSQIDNIPCQSRYVFLQNSADSIINFLTTTEEICVDITEVRLSSFEAEVAKKFFESC